MIIFYFFIIPLIYLPLKLILCLFIRKFGKFSYDGFSSAGFKYDAEKNLFYTTKNAWQRNFGYCHLYDVGAPIFNMIIDTQPVKFYYNNKNWLITFWKGQYGIVTGAEVGVYYTNELVVNKHTLYMPAEDNMLDIGITLYKKGEEIASMQDKHWWLAIFKLGMFSKPKDLSMDITIKFPNEKMLNAFLRSFKKLKYKNKYYEINDTTFKFYYRKPRTHKVWTRGLLIDGIRQYFNKRNAKMYNNYLADLIDNNGIDDSLIENKNDLIMLNDYVPDILKNKEENHTNESGIFLNQTILLNSGDNYEEVR